MNPRPLVFVTLPGRTLGALREQIVRAHAGGADVVEIRIDRCTGEEQAHLRALLPAPLPLLGTYRSRSEGGEGEDDPDARRQVLRSVQSSGFDLVDVELRRDLPGGAPMTPKVVSVHLPVRGSRADLSTLLRASYSPQDLVKVVTPASMSELFDDVLPAIPPAGENRALALTTGASGPLLRVWARTLGFPATFACLPEPLSGPEGPPAIEPSQVPVDHLVRWFRQEEAAPLFGVIGHPVAHSRSPRLLNAWMAAAGRPGLYVPLDFADATELTDYLPRLVEGGFLGFNVTHPFKQIALELATEASPAAERCGAANLLTFRSGECSADNTDLAALVRRLAELRTEEGWDGGHVTILGSGGGARAALEAARLLGAEVHLAARDPLRAQELADRFGAEIGPAPRRAGGVVIHATPAGRAGEAPLELPLDDLIVPGSRVLDLVYAPDDPFLHDRAVRVGASYEDGWRLLVYQAADSYRIWWGEEPSTELVQQALDGIRCAA